MFGFGKVKFRVVTIKTEEAAIYITNKLRKRGFKVYDLLESELLYDSDNSKDCDVYILCCEGKLKDFKKYKKDDEMKEIMYEGFRTLI